MHNLTEGKTNIDSSIYKSLFSELILQYLMHKKIYSDGSVCNGLRRCAIVMNNDSIKFRLLSFYSIFLCELYATLISLSIIEQHNLVKDIILSNALADVKTMRNCNGTSNIIRECQAKLFKLNKH